MFTCFKGLLQQRKLKWSPFRYSAFLVVGMGGHLSTEAALWFGSFFVSDVHVPSIHTNLLPVHYLPS